ncbi:MAG: transcriptional regulator GcvA [Proteobacteria bacterium]|nr:transcriptional regulator GcvA [Pseudomonadota bacterium]
MARRLPPLNPLVFFEAAGRHLSFTRASEELHVTQAAVSHQIKSLEEHLGIVLFHRLGRGQGLTLTESGRKYLPAVTTALDIIRTHTEALSRELRKRVLNILSLDSFGSLWLLSRLGRFMRGHPDTDVRITSAEIEGDALAKGRADIEIRYGLGNWTDVHAVRFLTETVFPVCSPQLLEGRHPLREPEDLRHHTLLHDVMATGWREWLEAAAVRCVDADRGPGFNHSNLVIQAAQMGEGVALGRGALVLDALAKGTLVKPFALVQPSPYAYFVATSTKANTDPIVRSFRDWLIQEGAVSQQELDRIAEADGHAQVRQTAADPAVSSPG